MDWRLRIEGDVEKLKKEFSLMKLLLETRQQQERHIEKSKSLQELPTENKRKVILVEENVRIKHECQFEVENDSSCSNEKKLKRDKTCCFYANSNIKRVLFEDFKVEAIFRAKDIEVLEYIFSKSVNEQ